ncbi:MAG: YigZ family protein [Lachnospiraceae bacterium]
MEEATYREIYRGGCGEIVEKKSRFIATVEKATTEEEAVAFITKMRKKYYDARHNCFAYVIGKNQQLQRCSDDGEPSQTAGKPMLDVLLRGGVHNVVVVVTRYFGGTLLGTGGLVHAYQKATQAGLADSVIIEKKEAVRMTVTTDYNGSGKLSYLFASENIGILDTQYTDQVIYDVLIPPQKKEDFLKKVTDATSAQAAFGEETIIDYAMIDGKIKIF